MMQKQYRLKNSDEIGRIVSKRLSARGKYYNVYFQYSDNFKIAFSASKKYGNAVERNNAKRKMREITRPYISLLKNVKVVVVIKKEAKSVSFCDLKSDLEKQISYILKKGAKNEEK